MRNENKIIFKSRVDILFSFLFLPLAIFIFSSWLYFNDYLSINQLIINNFVIILLPLIFTKQFFLFDNEFRVTYPGLGLSNRFVIKEISKIYFGSNNSVGDPCVIKVYSGQRIKKYYFFANKELQELIDKLRELGVTIEVNSHIWK